QQQRLDAMRVDHLLEWGPGKDREASILGCDERERVALILDELRGREMSGATELGRVHDRRRAAFDRFGDHDLLDPCPPVTSSYLPAEGQHLVLVGDDRCAVDGCQTRDRLY